MRDIVYYEEAFCDICGSEGAYDIYGDFVCHNCMHEAVVEDEEEDDNDE